MFQTELDITTADGAMNTFIVHPEGVGPFPVIIWLMDAPGKREELHRMTTRLAEAGYYVMLPNMYYRRVRAFDYLRDGRDVMFEHMMSLNYDLVCADFQALLDYASTDATAGDGKAGCVGYCMSGPFVFTAAARFPERVAAAASIHGVNLYSDAPDSPHLAADKIKGEMYFACADTDEWAPKAMIDNLDAHLKTTGINYRIEWFDNTGHGFVFPGRGDLYNEAAAETHWQRLFDLYERNL